MYIYKGIEIFFSLEKQVLCENFITGVLFSIVLCDIVVHLPLSRNATLNPIEKNNSSQIIYEFFNRISLIATISRSLECNLNLWITFYLNNIKVFIFMIIVNLVFWRNSTMRIDFAVNMDISSSLIFDKNGSKMH